MFKSMKALREKNAKAGFLFFDPKTMEFWDSKIETALYRGTYFITSEKEAAGNGERRFTIRQALTNGQIITVGSNRAHKTLEDAKEAVRKIVKDIPRNKKAKKVNGPG